MNLEEEKEKLNHTKQLISKIPFPKVEFCEKIQLQNGISYSLSENSFIKKKTDEFISIVNLELEKNWKKNVEEIEKDIKKQEDNVLDNISKIKPIFTSLKQKVEQNEQLQKISYYISEEKKKHQQALLLEQQKEELEKK